jgi:hypothetical protein
VIAARSIAFFSRLPGTKRKGFRFVKFHGNHKIVGKKLGKYQGFFQIIKNKA